MSTTRAIRRYAAYFRGWAQAFGEHQRIDDCENGLRWLLGDDQVGVILDPQIRRHLFAQVLGRHGQEPPPVMLDADTITIGDDRFPTETIAERSLQQVLRLVKGGGPLHLYQTYHLIYASGTRILTLSARSPLTILYREIPPITLRVADDLLAELGPAENALADH